MLSKIKALLDNLKRLLAHSVIAADIKDALDRVEVEAESAVKTAVAKIAAVTPEVEAAVQVALKDAIEAVTADIVGAL